MKFAIFGLQFASVDIRPLLGAWVAGLLGVILGVQDNKKIKFSLQVSMAARGLKIILLFLFTAKVAKNFKIA